MTRVRFVFRQWMLNGHPGNITRPCKRFVVRAHNRGLHVTATTDGVHSSTSWHHVQPDGKGHAVDVAAVMTAHGIEAMKDFQREEYRRHRRGATRYAELFGPINDRWVKNGIGFIEPEGAPLEDQHDNHVHGAFA
jgi:hypothetical protein